MKFLLWRFRKKKKMDETPKIVQLPQDVINQIAAGEVIHQPINVVKELFENAIDAGATQIEINLENGGFSLIQIIDNGSGISQQDLPNVCLRHSTSKIHQFIDLTTKLSTFGFRGEALFSMSCVSHMSITTKTENSDVALIAYYENGQMIGIPEPIASVKGTIVEVRDIFYNKPEKLRAIPDSNSQNRQVLQMATQYSIIYPQVSIIVNIDGKEKLHTIGNTNTESVLALLYGLTTDSAVFKVEADLGFKASAQLFLGTIASTRIMKGSAIFVNNRLVRCEKVKRSMEIVYSEFLKKGDKPFFVVMLTIPPRYVDVNVHPTKRDVNFENAQAIVERLCNIARERLAERIEGKSFKQKNTSSQSTIENSITLRSSSRKKKSEIEMQIQGSVQSSIITAPSSVPLSTPTSYSQPVQYNDETSDEPEPELHLSQNSHPNSFESIFDQYKYTGISSTSSKNDKNEQDKTILTKDNSAKKSITNETNSYFKNKSKKVANNNDTDLQCAQLNNDDVNDEFFNCSQEQNNDFSFENANLNKGSEDEFDDYDKEKEVNKIDIEETNNNNEEEESDSIDDGADDQNKTDDESPKKRRYGLNLQPLSQNPPTSKKATILSQSVSNKFSLKSAKSRPRSISLFDELKYEPSSAALKLTRGDPRERTIEQMFSLSAAINSKNDKNDEDDIHFEYRTIDLESIQELKEHETKEMNPELSQLFSKIILVGVLGLKYVFFSSDDTLYMCDLFALTRLFFYQLFLTHFANYGIIRFRPPIDINIIISEFPINIHDINYLQGDANEYVIEVLNNHAEMLDDYFRIKIKGNQLFNMPDILPGYEPSFTALGLFLIRLATEINWNCEYDCISAIVDELSMLYAIQAEDDTCEELVISMKKMIANVIIPEIKTEAFMPNLSLITDRSLIRLKSASEMYKIFERT